MRSDAEHATLDRGSRYPVVAQMFAARLRTTRRAQHLTLAEVASRIDRLGFHLDQHAIARIEHCERSVKLPEVLALAQALNVPPAQLCPELAP